MGEIGHLALGRTKSITINLGYWNRFTIRGEAILGDQIEYTLVLPNSYQGLSFRVPRQHVRRVRVPRGSDTGATIPHEGEGGASETYRYGFPLLHRLNCGGSGSGDRHTPQMPPPVSRAVLAPGTPGPGHGPSQGTEGDQDIALQTIVSSSSPEGVPDGREVPS